MTMGGEGQHGRLGGVGVSHKVCTLLKGSQIGVTLSKLGRAECNKVTHFCLGFLEELGELNVVNA